MGLGLQRDTIKRATQVVTAIQNSDQIWTDGEALP